MQSKPLSSNVSKLELSKSAPVDASRGEVRHRARPKPAAPASVEVEGSKASSSTAVSSQADRAKRWNSPLDEFVADSLVQNLRRRRGEKAKAELARTVQSVLKMAPEDVSEQMLAVQMQITHLLALEYALGESDGSPYNLRRREIAAKLMTLYARQKEVLDKSRGRGSHQRITVEQVTVKEGGNAIIGNVGQKPND